jgi:HD-GYP domain-containing protein (c-di-GMP phosphodiesterase class II)
MAEGGGPAGAALADGGMDFQTAMGLLAAAGSLGTALDLDFLLHKVGAAAEALLDSEASSIMLVSDDRKRLCFKVASGEKGQALKTMSLAVGEGIGGSVALSRRPAVVNDAAEDPRFAAGFDRTSGFVTRSVVCVPMLYRDELVGIIEVLNRRSGAYTSEHAGLLAHLASFAAAAIAQTKAVTEGRNFFSHILELVCLAIETARPNMEGHCLRSAKLARALGRSLGMDDYQCRMLNYAGMLHDAGYIAMSSPEFLADMGVLKAGEEVHPVLSAKLLEGITMLEGALPMILHHHERHDGTGYPDKLAGADIPLGARILAVVESVEELRMVGLRGQGLYAKALREVRDGSGRSFDPKVAAAFAEIIEAKSAAW